jgi:hypothetical protein
MYEFARNDSVDSWPTWMPFDQRQNLAEGSKGVRAQLGSRAKSAKDRMDQDLREDGSYYTATALLDRVRQDLDQSFPAWRNQWLSPTDRVTIKIPSGSEYSLTAADAQALILGAQAGLI